MATIVDNRGFCCFLEMMRAIEKPLRYKDAINIYSQWVLSRDAEVGVSFAIESLMAKMSKAGLLLIENETVCLTDSGRNAKLEPKATF